MKKILKFDLNHMVVAMPSGADILSIQKQGDKIVLWALCEVGNEYENRVFFGLATGQPMDCSMGQYIDTVQDGIYVWHYFEILKP